MLPPGLTTRLSARVNIDGRPSVSAPEPGRRHADGKMKKAGRREDRYRTPPHIGARIPQLTLATPLRCEVHGVE